MDSEDQYVGEPLSDAPKRDPSDTDCMARKKQKRDGAVVKDDDRNTLFGGYCRAWPGKGTDHVGEGRCSNHGGSGGAPAGPRNGNWVDGLNSTALRDEDREMLDAIEDMTTIAKMEETLNLQLVKLYRAVESMEDGRADTFWGAFEELVEKIDHPEETDLRAMAQMLGENDRAIREWMDLIRKTAKDLHKMRDGETVNVEHGVDSEELGELRDMADDLF